MKKLLIEFGCDFGYDMGSGVMQSRFKFAKFIVSGGNFIVFA